MIQTQENQLLRSTTKNKKWVNNFKPPYILFFAASTTSTSTTTTTSPTTTTSTSLMTTTTPSITSTSSSTTTTTTTTTSTTTTTTRLECMAEWTFFSFTNKCYKLFKTPVVQSVAETICINNGGHLVSIHSVNEDAFIRDIIVGPEAYYWIGLFAPGGCCNYMWLDGTPVDYTGWVPSAPTFSQGPCVYVVNVANHTNSGVTTAGWDNNTGYQHSCGGPPCASCAVDYEFVCESNLISVG
uniref:C-type lectin domain-containing protein n=1 Tax=Acrobeloides nanus TaxID=290746 RepID=A0A914EKQ6_9BILA